MKKIFFLTTIIVSVLLSGCSNEDVFENYDVDKQSIDSKEKTLTFVATMPAETSETDIEPRIALEQSGMNVTLAWESTDKLHLCLVYGLEGNKTQVREVVGVTIFPDNEKRASFSFTLPDDITDEFILYGVYGGNGLSEVEGDEHWAILPTSSQYLGSSLQDLQDSKAVMLKFEKEFNLNDADPDLNVNFEHVGSLFSIQVNNNSGNSWEGVKKVELQSTTETTIGAHVNTSGTGQYNIITGGFRNTESQTSLLFELPTAVDIAAGESAIFWGWYPPVSGVNWPGMTLSVSNNLGTSWETDESKPARTSPTAVGKTFYFATYFNGTGLSFEDSQTDIIFVSPNATGNGTGTSWSNAMGDISEAITKANSGTEIWIQGGTYAIETTIALKNGVNLYGSFSGIEESINERKSPSSGNHWDFDNPTILDGQGKIRIMSAGTALTSETIVDGITYTGGYHTSRAGALEINSTFAVIQNCIMRENSAPTNGGAIFMRAGIIRRTLIEDNSVTNNSNGGGLYIAGTSSTPGTGEAIIEECTFKGNSASQGGGGLYNGSRTPMTYILKSKFYNNTATTRSNALQNAGTTFEMSNCLVYNNYGSGGAMNHSGGSIYNSTFVNNEGGNVIYFGDSNHQFVNNIVWGNITPDGVSTDVAGPGLDNSNTKFQNNAVTLTQENMNERPGEFTNNITLGASEINAPRFVLNTTFIGGAENQNQKEELEYIDLNILEISPCYNTGITIMAVTHDIIGTPRPQGAGYDIGAYERVP